MWIQVNSFKEMFEKDNFDCFFSVKGQVYKGRWSKTFLKFIDVEKQSNQFDCDLVQFYLIIEKQAD